MQAVSRGTFVVVEEMHSESYVVAPFGVPRGTWAQILWDSRICDNVPREKRIAQFDADSSFHVEQIWAVLDICFSETRTHCSQWTVRRKLGERVDKSKSSWARKLAE